MIALMMMVIAYLVFVGLGPLLFTGLIRPLPTVRRFTMGVASALMMIVGAWLMHRYGQGAAGDVGWLLCLWFGWLVTLAMMVQAVTLCRGRGRPRVWSAALGAAASVLPWFGLSLAVSAAG
ncbi:hypothetical protein U5922_013840 [Aquicoccus sp. G2-2]|uniref:hypothetical protein n=1 Tax=Aquicoccus sp. G2-2 TaxID=3092120 RepID=UPI002ADF4C6F|nr:hypothetical protein [Aquicoccus sp. G2-2]MEA1114486.1 hypothetical protein [Aquicoccus sp. G2-2]